MSVTNGSRFKEHTNGSAPIGDDRLPPHNRDAERSLLSSMLRDNGINNNVVHLVKADHFYVYGHQKIYEAITKLNDDGKAADIVTVADWLMQPDDKGMKPIDDVGGPSYLAELWDAAPSAAHYRQYAEIIRQKAIARNLIHCCTEVQRDAYDQTTPPGELLRSAERRILEIAEAGATAGYRFAPMSTRDFMRADFRPEWGIEKVFLLGQPMVIGGPKKSLKTSILVDMVLSMAAALPFLGMFEARRRFRVALISGESGKYTIQETARRVAIAKGIGSELLNDLDVLWDFRLPQLANEAELLELTRGLKRLGIDVVVIDPLYLSLLAGSTAQATQASNLFDMGPLLLRVADACLRAGATPILAHHAVKQRGRGFDPIDLDELAFSGIAEFARSWLLVSRREAYEAGTGQHRLWLQTGGSIGHGGLFAMDLNEGQIGEDLSGRIWDVTVMTAGESRKTKTDERAEEKRRTELAKERDEDARLLGALDRADPDRKGVSYTRLRDASGLDKRAGKTAERLIVGGFLVEIPGFKTETGRPARGLKRPTSGTSGQEIGALLPRCVGDIGAGEAL